MTWIQTHSGKAFDVTRPEPGDVVIEDIAHALCMLCRFNGHTDRFYSVAEHSLLVLRCCETCSPATALTALLHDAHEAYTGDLADPLKRHAWLMDSGGTWTWSSLEDGVQVAILIGLGLRDLVPRIDGDRYLINKADRRALATEKRDLLGDCERAWDVGAPPLARREMDLRYPAPMGDVKIAFLEEYHTLARAYKQSQIDAPPVVAPVAAPVAAETKG